VERGICPIATLSQCSTVVRNAVVRATIKVNGKPQILGTRSPQTPKSIDLKFDLDDYVSCVTIPARNGTNRPSRAGGAKRCNIMFNWVIFSVFTFLAKLWKTHFWEHRHIFLHWMTGFGEIRIAVTNALTNALTNQPIKKSPFW